ALVQNLKDTFSDSEEATLFDPASQVRLVSARERRLMVSLGRRLRVAKDMPVEKAAKVVDRAQDHLLEVAWAHVDRILLEALLAAAATLTTDTARDVLQQARDVYFLDLIARNGSC